MKYRLVVLTLLATGLVSGLCAPAWAYRHNYTCDTQSRPCREGQTPHSIRWDHSCVLFYLDEHGSDDFPRGSDGRATPALEGLVKASFDTWNKPACSGIQLLYGGMVDPAADPPGQRRNVVSFEQHWDGTSATTFATTIVNYDPNTGVIHDADIKVNDEFYRFATTPTPGPGEADLQNTLTHEAGHFLGFAHSRHPEATMYGSASLGETKKRTLARDDIDGLCATYPVAEYHSTCGRHEDVGSETGDGSFGWGSPKSTDAASACSVTGLGRSATLPPVMLMLGLIGGVFCRRRHKRSSDD